MPFTPVTQNPIVRQVASAATLNDAYIIHTGLTITSYPTSVVASENPITWAFSSPVIGASQSWYQGYVEILNTGITADTRFILSSTTVGAFPTFEFTAAAEPRVNEFYCNTTLPARTTAQMAESLAGALNANFSFRQRFVVTYAGPFCYFESLYPGSHWNMDYYSLNGASYLNYSDITVATDYYNSQNYIDWGVWADLYIYSTGDLGSNLDRTYSERIAQFENSYDSSNLYTFDASGSIKNYISTPIPIITAATLYTGSVMQQQNDALVNFYYVFGEKYDEFNNRYRRQFLRGQTNIVWALNSSVAYNEVNSLSAYTITNNVTATTINYLTTSPSPKQTYYESNEWLSFLYSNSEGAQLANLNFWMMVDLNYSDGTVDQDFYEIDWTTIGASGGGLYCACVSPQQFLTGSTANGQMLNSYTVRLIQSSGAGSYYVRGVDKTYELVDDCLLDGATQFMWLNSLGGWDTFYFNGESGQDMDRKITTFQISTPFQNDYYPIATINKLDINKKFTSNSAYINKTHLDWLLDFFKSTKQYIIQNGIQIPIVVTSGTWKCISNDDLFQVSAEYVYGIDENYIRQ